MTFAKMFSVLCILIVPANVLAQHNPRADDKAIVTVGNARFTILTSRLIRLEWSSAGNFEDHASLVFINRNLPVPKY